MFMDLTHFYSGETVSVRANAILTVRDCGERTLIIDSNGRGQYVREPRTVVVDLITAIESSRIGWEAMKNGETI